MKKRSRQAITYPHVERKAGVVGGEPIVKGTRTSVRTIAGYYQMGMTPDEIRHGLSHLTLAEIHGALWYYFDHQKEIDTLIAVNSDYEHWKNMALVHPRQGK